MKLAVGDKVLMQYATLGDRILGVVTEVSEGEKLVVYSPLRSKTIEHLQRNNLAIIKFAHEGVLRGYRTEVIGVANGHGAVVTLKYPTEKVDVEYRCEPRCPCCFPARLDCGGDVYESFVVDMSTQAFRIRFNHPENAPEATDESVILDFYVFEPSNSYRVNCEIMKIFMTNNEKFAVLAIKDGEGVQGKIRHYVESQCRGGFLNQV